MALEAPPVAAVPRGARVVLIWEALLSICSRGLGELGCDTRDPHSDHNGPAGLEPPRVAWGQGIGTHGCCWRCQSFWGVPGTRSGHASSDFSRLRGWWSLCVPALKPRPESVVMRFYDVFWQGLVILCVDLLSNELSDFEMFCATLFWKGHCILFMGRVSFYETLFSF